MAITFLTAVSSVLARVGEISQDVSQLTTFGDSARGVKIGICIQCWNDVLLNIITSSTVNLPKAWKNGSIALVSGQNNYDLPSDFEQIEWPLTNVSDGYIISEYQGGYNRFRVELCQPQLFTGTPYFAVIDPTTRQLLVDTIPQSDDDGRVYNLFYQSSARLVNETDTFPFTDDAVVALYGAVAELYKYEKQRIWDKSKYESHVATAIRIITPNAMRTTW